ncbi:hypothetical protein F2Q70_00031619 [Brassica cretica]|uniref:Leucine zipper homeobox-associated domain-containing protein n=1 Tax=Brassica cretica TaxID=69181 RepID=A0A8S9FCY0_BRACR|nr:hypothetical protein F2Q70_00031619 [Brassica cretica]
MASSRRHRWPPGAASRWPAEAERDEAGFLTSSVVVSGLPYRMAAHPREGALICALPESCKRFDWENIMRPREGEELEEVINELEDVGQQLALAFNQEGSVLAAGGEDGTLRIFEWPSMKTILNESNAHGEVKNLTFSESGKFLVSLGGPLCRVWDVNASTAVASLSKEKDELFASCRFSVDNSGDEVLYIAAKTVERGGSIITWDTTSWKRKQSKLLKNYSITAFNVSPDGKFLAFGTLEGDVLIISSTKMKTHQFVKKAHLGLVTALTFSPDSRFLVSVSFDSRAKLSVIEQKPETSTWNKLAGGVFVVRVASSGFVLFLDGKGDQIIDTSVISVLNETSSSPVLERDVGYIGLEVDIVSSLVFSKWGPLRRKRTCARAQVLIIYLGEKDACSLFLEFLSSRFWRSKLKQTEMECEYLKRWFGSLTEQNHRLHREVEELRAMNVGPPTVTSASSLTMCPRCERVTTAASAASPSLAIPSQKTLPPQESEH